MKRLRTLAATTGIALALCAIACDDKKASTPDAAPSSKPLPVVSARTTRLDCGGSFGVCPPGEYCFYDKPGCDTTGYCGPAEPPCAHSITFCGCTGIELACTFPKRQWREQGRGCFTSEPTTSASASASASASSDAGRKAP